jgi:branched-chain amino acid transport system ATP-binding protein
MTAPAMTLGDVTSNGGPVAPVLELRGVTAGYGRTTVLREVTVTVPKGSVVALLGPNGAGKTTMLRTAAGLLRATAGEVRVGGEDMTRRAPNQRAKHGLCLIPEGRGIFRALSVRDNLRMQVPPWAQADGAVDRAVQAFPVLGERMDQLAGNLSGGQQQMLALSRAFVTEPSVVLLDEVSMGLAPRIVDQIFTALKGLTEKGVALLLVEQYVSRALELADIVNLLDRGRISYSGPASGLDEAAVLRGYLGVDTPGAATAPGASSPTGTD